MWKETSLRGVDGVDVSPSRLGERDALSIRGLSVAETQGWDKGRVREQVNPDERSERKSMSFWLC